MKRIRDLMSRLSDLMSDVGDAIHKDVEDAFKSAEPKEAKPTEATSAKTDYIRFDMSQIADILVQHVQQTCPGRRVKAVRVCHATSGSLWAEVTFESE